MNYDDFREIIFGSKEFTFDGEDEFIASDYYTGEVGLNYEVYDITDNGLVRIDTISWKGIRQRIDN